MAVNPSDVETFMKDVAEADTVDGYVNLGDPSDSNAKFPSAEMVWELIKQMDGLNEEETNDLYEHLFKSKSNSLPKAHAQLQPHLGHTMWDYLICLAMASVILLFFALFGYKLYKSLKAKELKRQEKLKQKQSKKSKKAN